MPEGQRIDFYFPDGKMDSVALVSVAEVMPAAPPTARSRHASKPR